MDAATTAAEAARYALLRRLAPAIRHHLVVNLQPVGMVHEVMERRLQAAAPDLAVLRDSAQKINGFARAAQDACLDIVGWLAPPAGAVAPLDQGVRECLGLVATGLGFRGYTIRNEVPEGLGPVGRGPLRHVLTAALLHITDVAPGPALVLLQAQERPGGVELSLRLQPAPQARGFEAEPIYRPLAWDDLQALAAADSVELRREGDAIRIGLDCAGPPV